MTSDPWLDEAQQRAWRQFLTMQARLLGALSRHLQRECGISVADYAILVHLSESKHGRMRTVDLGTATQWEKSRLSHQLTRMSRRGLVRREARPGSPRHTEIVLTDAGRATIVTAAPNHVAHVRGWFAEALAPERLAAFADACQAVIERLHDPPPGAGCDRPDTGG